MVSPEKRLALTRRMDALQIKEAEIIEKFIRGNGRGGQKINKTSSCVYLKHQPTGLEVKCQQERSREMNRFLARRELCDIFEHKILGRPPIRRLNRLDKLRRAKQRRAKRARLLKKSKGNQEM